MIEQLPARLGKLLSAGSVTTVQGRPRGLHKLGIKREIAEQI
jgi:hypothetical protein